MSNRLLNLAWQVPVSAAAKIVLVALADRANDAGKSWPSRDMLCAQTGLSPASVSLQVKFLADAGLLAQQRRRQRSAEYTLDERALILAGKWGDKAATAVAVDEADSEKSSSDMSTSKTSTTYMSTSESQDVQELDIPKENPHRTITLTSGSAPDTPADRFDEFWSAYPKRGGKSMAKDDARKAWRTVLKAITKPDDDGITWTVDQIIAGARRFASECETYADRGLVKMPAGWLRAGGWKYDDATTSRADPVEWLRQEWLRGRVTEIQKSYVADYTQPPPGDGDYLNDVLIPHNRAWIERHRDAILARLAHPEAS